MNKLIIDRFRLPKYAIIDDYSDKHTDKKIFIIHLESMTVAMLLIEDNNINPQYNDCIFVSKNGHHFSIFKSIYTIDEREKLQNIVDGMSGYIQLLVTIGELEDN